MNFHLKHSQLVKLKFIERKEEKEITLARRHEEERKAVQLEPKREYEGSRGCAWKGNLPIIIGYGTCGTI